MFCWCGPQLAQLLRADKPRLSEKASARGQKLRLNQSHANYLVTWSVVWADVWADVGTAVVVTRSTSDLAPAAAAISVVLSPQSSEPLLLGVCVDVCADDEPDNVEEGHPGALRQELLGESQRDRGDDPADLHDWPEASLDSRADLVECTGASDERH